MNYNSVTEIFDDIDRTRARLFQSVEGLSDAQQGFRAAPDRWSVAEVLEHLSIIERRVTKLIAALLDKAESAGQTRAAARDFSPVPAPARRADRLHLRALPAPRLGAAQPLSMAPLHRRTRSAPPRADRSAKRDDERGTMN